MIRSLTALVAVLSVCPALPGCLHQAGFCRHAPPSAAAGTACGALPAVERGHLEPDAATLPIAVSPSAAQDKFRYRGLTVEQCRCLAARNAEVANLLDAERQGVAEGAAQSGWFRAHQAQELADVKQTILWNGAQEIRNRNAGAALELYYHLAEAEAKIDLVEQSLQNLRDVSDKFQEMKKKGLRLPVDFETLARQQVELQIQQTQLQQALDQLNGELMRLLGLHGCALDERLWPTGEFSIPSGSIDVDAAVAQGLAQRPELTLLREVEQKLDARTLPAVRQLARSFNGLLGMVNEQPRLLLAAVFLRALRGESPIATELEVRRQQLRQQLADRERAVAQEIRQAVRTLAAQHQLVALTRQKVQSWKTKLQELEDKHKQGLASLVDVALAKLDWLRARGELVKEVTAWHIARVKLKQAQGILPLDCDGSGTSSSCAATSTVAP